jgi:hypothetical protein
MTCMAVRAGEAQTVRDAVVRYATAHGVPAEPVGPDRVTEDTVSGYPARGGWVITSWPELACGRVSSRWLSRDLATAVSTVHVVDGNYWAHSGYECGHDVDHFSPLPDNNIPLNLLGDPEAVQRIHHTYEGNPDRLAQMFHRPAEVIAPYLAPRLDLPDDTVSFPKAYPDDEYDLYDCWEFVDLWRRMGISYPAEEERPTFAVEFHGPGVEGLPEDFGEP